MESLCSTKKSAEESEWTDNDTFKLKAETPLGRQLVEDGPQQWDQKDDFLPPS